MSPGQKPPRRRQLGSLGVRLNSKAAKLTTRKPGRSVVLPRTLRQNKEGIEGRLDPKPAPKKVNNVWDPLLDY